MGWKRGESGNPTGRRPSPEPVGLVNPEPISIPILRRRDPAGELVKLADASKSERFKLQVWIFLFEQKYKRANVVAKPVEAIKVDATSDIDLLTRLEAQEPKRARRTHPRPVVSETVETLTELDTI